MYFFPSLCGVIIIISRCRCRRFRSIFFFLSNPLLNSETLSFYMDFNYFKCFFSIHSFIHNDKSREKQLFQTHQSDLCFFFRCWNFNVFFCSFVLFFVLSIQPIHPSIHIYVCVCVWFVVDLSDCVKIVVFQKKKKNFFFE